VRESHLDRLGSAPGERSPSLCEMQWMGRDGFEGKGVVMNLACEELFGGAKGADGHERENWMIPRHA
jgi:hypothetical protein